MKRIDYEELRRRVERILIIKLRAIGDVILTTPVIENLRAAFPEAEIIFLTERAAEAVVKDHPDLDDVWIFDRSYIASLPPHQALAENWRFLRQIRSRRFDLVFDLFGNPRSAVMTRFSGAPVRVGFDFRGRKFAYNVVVPPRGDRVHEVRFNLDALDHLGIPIVSSRLYIPLSDLDEAFAEEFWNRTFSGAAPVVGLSVSGGWYTKRWPLEKFARLADRLVQQFDARILLLWGPGERSDVERVQKLMQQAAVIAPLTDLKQLAAILKRLDLMVSNDSGPMHLAAAVGVPVVGIYGPTLPQLQGPWGKGHRTVRLEGLDCLGCNGVTCRIETHDCMQQLGVEPVLAAVESVLQETVQGK